MGFTTSELNAAYFYRALFNIRDSLQNRYPKINFKADVDFNLGIGWLPIHSFITFPVLEATIDY
jgi:hypothetical protein